MYPTQLGVDTNLGSEGFEFESPAAKITLNLSFGAVVVTQW